MNRKRLFCLVPILCLALLEQVGYTQARAPLNVRTFGALGDGTTKDTAAFQKALDACAAAGGGEVLVPAGNYLIGSIALKSNTTLRLEKDANLMGSPDLDDYPIIKARWEGRWVDAHRAGLRPRRQEHRHRRTGENRRQSGLGRPANAPPAMRRRADQLHRRPSRRFFRATSAHVGNPSHILRKPGRQEPHHSHHRNQRRRHRYRLLQTRPHRILRHRIGRRLHRRQVGPGNGRFSPRQNHRGRADLPLHAQRDSCMPASASAAKAPAASATCAIEHCKLVSSAKFAIHIKSRDGRGAFIDDLSFKDLEVGNAKGGFLRINLTNTGIQDPEPVPGEEGIPSAKNFSFTDIKIDNCGTLVEAKGISPVKPLDGLTIENLTGTCRKGMTLANINRANLRNIKVEGFTGPLLTTANVTGAGLEDAVPYRPTAEPAGESTAPPNSRSGNTTGP